jgi:MscS family membrane protein
VKLELPNFLFEVSYYQAPIWKWLALIVLALLAWIVASLFARGCTVALTRPFTTGDDEPRRRTISLLRKPVQLFVAIALLTVAIYFLRLPQQLVQATWSFELALLAFSGSWVLFRSVDVGALGLRSRAQQSGSEHLSSIVDFGVRITKLFVLIISVLAILGTLGVNINAAVAGLGIGGVAIAFAAQKTLENFIGGIVIFIDQPVRVGDFFKFGDTLGTVEEIGVRSTRIRTLDRTVITVPNGDFSNRPVENYARRDMMRIRTLLSIRYETTPDQMRFLLTNLRKVLIEHPKVLEESRRVRFFEFAAYSLNIEIVAYVETTDWSEYLAIREDVYLRYMDVVKEAGASFAFPSSTMYLGKDVEPNQSKIESAEAAVAAWRKEGTLPFPDYPDDARVQMENTSDWPPKGSALRFRDEGKG